MCLLGRGTHHPSVDVVFGYRSAYIAGTVRPVDAVVSIDGAAVTVVGGRFNDSVVPGPYAIHASARGYEGETFHVNATAGNVTTQAIALSLAPVGGSNHSSSGPSLVVGGLPVLDLAALAGAAVVAVAVAVLFLRPRGR